MRNFSEIHEKVMRKSREIHALNQLQTCLLLSVQLEVTLSRPKWVATRPWLASLSAKGNVKKWQVVSGRWQMVLKRCLMVSGRCQMESGPVCSECHFSLTNEYPNILFTTNCSWMNVRIYSVVYIFRNECPNIFVHVVYSWMNIQIYSNEKYLLIIMAN